MGLEVEPIEEKEIFSSEQRCNSILKRAFSLAYEDNPCRTEWPLHKVDCDVVIKNPIHQKGDVYYLSELYLPEELLSELIGITEGLPGWIDVYLSGRCSLHATLHVYTPERLEEKLDQAEQILAKVEKAKLDFIASQNIVEQ